MHTSDNQTAAIRLPSKETVKILCIVFFMIILPMFILFSCFAFIMSQTNRTQPKLDKRFEITLDDDDVLNDLCPHCNGFIYLVNGKEIHIIGEEGESLGAFWYKSEVTAIGNYDGSGSFEDHALSVALSDQTILLYQYNDGKYEETDHIEVPGIVTQMCCDFYNQCTYLLEDGTTFQMFLSHTDTEEDPVDHYLSPEFICDDVKLITNYSGVRKDNSIIRFSDGLKATPIKEEIIGINRNIVYTKNAAYSYYFGSTATERAVFEDGQFYVWDEGYFYRKDGKFYYTGLLSGKWRGKGIPESENGLLKLPESDRYFAITCGAVCYKDHTLVCYWV